MKDSVPWKAAMKPANHWLSTNTAWERAPFGQGQRRHLDSNGPHKQSQNDTGEKIVNSAWLLEDSPLKSRIKRHPTTVSNRHRPERRKGWSFTIRWISLTVSSDLSNWAAQPTERMAFCFRSIEGGRRGIRSRKVLIEEPCQL